MAVNMVYIDNGEYGHPDLKRAWDIFKRECINAGKPVPRIMQAAGNAKASADTHKDGMAVDWDSTDPWYATLWRKITSGPAWPRLWPGNYHTHGALPNSTSAAYQVHAYRARRDGLGWQGLKGKDTLQYYPPMALDKALARWEGRIPVDGKLGPVTVRALQSFLNARGERLAVDGIFGGATMRALGKYLSRNGRMRAASVGDSAATCIAFRKWRNVRGGHDYWIDKTTTKAMQQWLNAAK